MYAKFSKSVGSITRRCSGTEPALLSSGETSSPGLSRGLFRPFLFSPLGVISRENYWWSRKKSVVFLGKSFLDRGVCYEIFLYNNSKQNLL